MIDTLQYSQDLIAVGFTPEQARLQASTLVKAIEKSSATKEDLLRVENSLREEIAGIRGEIKLVKWMLALIIVVQVRPYLKTFLAG